MALLASSLDLSDAVLLGYFIGALSTVLIGGLTNSFVLGRKQKYEKLIRWTEHLLNYDNQIVTVTDLVLKTQLSPKECQKFLNKFVVELDGEIKYTDSGKLYYQFPTADNLESTQGKKYQKLVKWTEHILNYHNQMITVTDLVLKTELSPNECQEFLDRFIAELGGKTNYTESGQVYYQFSTAKNLELKKLPEEI